MSRRTPLATPSITTTPEEWSKRLADVNVSKHDLNLLVANYLFTEGYVSAAEHFSREAGVNDTEPTSSSDAGGSAAVTLGDVDSIGRRMDIRRAVLRGDVEAALEKVVDLDLEILDLDPTLHFHLLQQRLIELIRADDIPTALAFATNELAPLAEEHPQFLKELERTMALLAFEMPTLSFPSSSSFAPAAAETAQSTSLAKDDTKKKSKKSRLSTSASSSSTPTLPPMPTQISALLDPSHRLSTAAQLNAAILRAQGHPSEPKLLGLLGACNWGEGLLRERGVEVKGWDIREDSIPSTHSAAFNVQRTSLVELVLGPTGAMATAMTRSETLVISLPKLPLHSSSSSATRPSLPVSPIPHNPPPKSVADMAAAVALASPPSTISPASTGRTPGGRASGVHKSTAASRLVPSLDPTTLANRRGSASTTGTAQTTATSSSNASSTAGSFVGNDGRAYQMYPRPRPEKSAKIVKATASGGKGKKAIEGEGEATRGKKGWRVKGLFASSSIDSSTAAPPTQSPSSTSPPAHASALPFAPSKASAPSSRALQKAVSFDSPPASPSMLPRMSVYGGPPGVAEMSQRAIEPLTATPAGRNAFPRLPPLSGGRVKLERSTSSSGVTAPFGSAIPRPVRFTARPATSSGAFNSRPLSGFFSTSFSTPRDEPQASDLPPASHLSRASSPAPAPASRPVSPAPSTPSTAHAPTSLSFRPASSTPSVSSVIGDTRRLSYISPIEESPPPSSATLLGASRSSAAVRRRSFPARASVDPASAARATRSIVPSSPPSSTTRSTFPIRRPSSAMSGSAPATPSASARQIRKKPSLGETALKAIMHLRPGSAAGLASDKDGGPCEEEIASWRMSRVVKSEGGDRGSRADGLGRESVRSRSGNLGASGPLTEGECTEGTGSDEVLDIIARPESRLEGVGPDNPDPTFPTAPRARPQHASSLSDGPSPSAASPFPSVRSSPFPTPHPAIKASPFPTTGRRPSAPAKSNPKYFAPGALPDSSVSPFLSSTLYSPLTSNSGSPPSASPGLRARRRGREEEEDDSFNVLDFIAMDEGRAEPLPFRFPQAQSPRGGAFFPSPNAKAVEMARAKSADTVTLSSVGEDSLRLGSGEAVILSLSAKMEMEAEGTGLGLATMVEGGKASPLFPSPACGGQHQKDTRVEKMAGGSRLPQSMQKLFSSPGQLMSRSPSSSAALASPFSPSASAALPPDAPSPILPTFPPSPSRATSVFPLVASPPSSPPPRPPRSANRPSPHSSPQSRQCRPVSAASSPPASPTGVRPLLLVERLEGRSPPCLSHPLPYPGDGGDAPPRSPSSSPERRRAVAEKRRSLPYGSRGIVDLAKGLAAAVAAAEVDQIEGTPPPSPPTSEEVHEFGLEENEEEKGGLGAVLALEEEAVQEEEESEDEGRIMDPGLQRMLAGARA
ncbi:hypothetical protein JCM11641_001294 [Rhodosporidiobolus odoratus]